MRARYNPITEEFEASQERPVVAIEKLSGRLLLSPYKRYVIKPTSETFGFILNFDYPARVVQTIELTIFTSGIVDFRMNFPDAVKFVGSWIIEPYKIYNIKIDSVTYIATVDIADR